MLPVACDLRHPTLRDGSRHHGFDFVLRVVLQRTYFHQMPAAK
jgi:hypothetical protein